jgi:hypothetical protein
VPSEIRSSSPKRKGEYPGFLNSPTIIKAEATCPQRPDRAGRINLPAPVDLPPATSRERAAWRKEFEERGREAVRVAVYGGQQPYAGDKRDAAIEWLRKKEIADEKRAAKTYHYLKWTLDAAIAAAVLALIGVLWATGVIPHWMQVLQ